MQFLPKVSIHTRFAIYDDVAPDLIAWTTGKSYGQPIGTFSLTLSTRPDAEGLTWFDKLSAQDFVIIRMSLGGGPEETIMNGLIDRVGRTTNVSSESGAVNEVIQVAGSDLTKVLTQGHVWYNPWKDSLSSLVLGKVDLTALLKGLSPAKLLESLLAIVLDDDTNAVVQKVKAGLTGKKRTAIPTAIDLQNNGIKMAEVLKFHSSISDDIFANVVEMTRFQGAIWNMFTKFANKPWNELWVDTGSPANAEDRAGVGGTPSMQKDDKITWVNLRETPFTDELFNSLVLHEISFADIQGPLSVSKGDSDTYTYYFARPVMYVLFTKPEWSDVLIQPKIAGEGAVSPMTRFGFRPLKQEYVYRGKDTESGGEGVSDLGIGLAQGLSEKLFDFFDRNSEFLTTELSLKPNRLTRSAKGQVRLPKIGHRLRIKKNPKGRPDEEYYITGVSHKWTFSGSYSLALRLTRGVVKKTVG